MVKVVWTDLALADLKSIHEYISKDSKFYADRYVDKLIKRVDQLENYPQSGRMVPEFSKEYIRELIEGSYRIIFIVEADRIGIIRVHHSAQQLKNI
ncbi:type II toxin-antitoxin system RelE/ParE family toxin [Solitalea sp. MAHUQ-68]|uniref:Type II toxin-antitoxin system RelE/ParE family toxin n=1 Tax=Solitalea agri TaxID=2953739 RepID=A0A9X2F3C7_9SPHI|nr:type II toxin-antitoxin system RelE/ParE family toxin [Solitalea agri]MCO4294029.1 type II toxin-antitoxin system RelE/ParE family toxin [Solitalea agri]